MNKIKSATNCVGIKRCWLGDNTTKFEHQTLMN